MLPETRPTPSRRTGGQQAADETTTIVRLTGCPCGCNTTYWLDDPDCIRHTTPLQRYRLLVAARRRLRGAA